MVLLPVVAFLSYVAIRNFRAIRRMQAEGISQNPNRIRVRERIWSGWMGGLLYTAIGFLVLSFLSPLIFTGWFGNSGTNFTGNGAIGDTIGGLMNPFIAIGSVIVTGLAFYMQFQANNLQTRQFRLQQFESQFYEMIRLHRENVSEMRIEGYNYNDDFSPRDHAVTEGRLVFESMITELVAILSVGLQQLGDLNEASYQLCFRIFFDGIDSVERPFGDEFIGKLNWFREIHNSPTESSQYRHNQRKTLGEFPVLDFNYDPFSGHASRLGHYYRNLYLAVKSVVNSELLNSVEERMKYLRILRAQLSDNEQTLLFYNWLGTHGGKWENRENAFFSQYSMLHNLQHDSLFPVDFIAERVEFIRKRAIEFGNLDPFEIG
jgi:hypothetical protein